MDSYLPRWYDNVEESWLRMRKRLSYVADQSIQTHHSKDITQTGWCMVERRPGLSTPCSANYKHKTASNKQWSEEYKT